MENSLQELIAIRLKKRADLQGLGVDPHGHAFATLGSVAQVREQFIEGQPLRIAGRITAYRKMGKSHFLDLSDFTARMQVYVPSEELDERSRAVLKALDIGDFIGIAGVGFITRTGEATVRTQELTFLSKSLRPLPDKWHGVQNTELCYRKRYLDLIANARSREIFHKRIQILRVIRHFLEAQDFLEVETPMMQPMAGGAAAQPFQTHHHALGRDLFLRIAPELYLKRLLVAGFPRVFELNRNFRNEGISRRHNPEFTMLEAYWAYADFEQMADFVEELICTVAESVCAGLMVEHHNAEGEVIRTLNLQRPWKRARYADLIRSVQPDWYELTSEARRQRGQELGLDLSHCHEDFEITQHLFEKFVEEKTFDPLFVTHCPKELVPLAKLNGQDDSLVDVYELIMNGQEISPGYSELNDPILQRERLEHQSGEEVQNIDEDFLESLEYGMPPAGGLGIGIDRLVMALTGADSIRDVLLVPQMKPEQGG